MGSSTTMTSCGRLGSRPAPRIRSRSRRASPSRRLTRSMVAMSRPSSDARAACRASAMVSAMIGAARSRTSRVASRSASAVGATSTPSSRLAASTGWATRPSPSTGIPSPPSPTASRTTSTAADGAVWPAATHTRSPDVSDRSRARMTSRSPPSRTTVVSCSSSRSACCSAALLRASCSRDRALSMATEAWLASACSRATSSSVKCRSVRLAASSAPMTRPRTASGTPSRPRSPSADAASSAIGRWTMRFSDT